MSKKRIAADYLTHDNWDQEEEEDSEEPGQFAVANEDVLQKRVIKIAKRKTITKTNETESKNAFQGFSFGVASSSSDAPKLPSFSFQPTGGPTTSSTSTIFKKAGDESGGSKNTEVSGSMSNVVTFVDDDKPESSYLKEIRRLNESFLKWVTHHVTKNPECILTPILKDYNKYIDGLGVECASSQESAEEDVEGRHNNRGGVADANSKLARSPLRKTVTDIITSTTTANSLAPESSSSSSSSSSVSSSLSTTTTNIFSFSSNLSTSTSSSAPASNKESTLPQANSIFSGFKFGKIETNNATTSSFGGSFFSLKPKEDGSTAKETVNLMNGNDKDSKEPDNKPLLTFGSCQDQGNNNKNEASTTGTNQKFAFSGVTPFSFGTSSTSASVFGKGFFSKPPDTKEVQNSDATAGDQEEEYEPPKVEIVENKEEGSFYTIRCKLYYKKDDKYEERGVGFLHLKPNGNKTQLIIRTDTALGNILLNINIDKLMPISRQGANNVNIFAIPNPPLDPKKPSQNPILILIRVKTKENADELFKQLTGCQAKLPS